MKKVWILLVVLCLAALGGCESNRDSAESETVSTEEAKYCFPDSNVRLDADKDEIFKVYNIGKDPSTVNDLMFESLESINIYGKEYRFFVFLNDDSSIYSISASRDAKGTSDSDLEELKQNMEKIYGKAKGENVYTWRVNMPGDGKPYNIKIKKNNDKAHDFESVALEIYDASADIDLEKSESELIEKQAEMAGNIAKSAADFIEGIQSEKTETDDTEIDYERKHGDSADEIRGYDEQIEEIEDQKESIQQEIDKILK